MSTEVGGAARSEAKRALLAKLLAEEARRPRSHPLSSAQERLWFLDQLVPGSAAYNVAQAFRLRGALDLDALRRSLSAIVERQGSLRTRFLAAEGRARQVAAEGGRFEVPLLAVAAGEGAEGEAQRLVDEEAARPFDLLRGPLFRSTVVRLAPDDHVLLLVVHHIAADGWSMGVLLRELGQLYGSFL